MYQPYSIAGSNTKWTSWLFCELFCLFFWVSIFVLLVFFLFLSVLHLVFVVVLSCIVHLSCLGREKGRGGQEHKVGLMGRWEGSVGGVGRGKNYDQNIIHGNKYLNNNYFKKNETDKHKGYHPVPETQDESQRSY